MTLRTLRLRAASATCVTAATAAPSAPAELTFGKTIVVETLIADGVALRTEHCKRLLKDERRRLALGDRRIKHIKAILVQVDGDIRPRRVGVRQLKHVPRDQIDVVK